MICLRIIIPSDQPLPDLFTEDHYYDGWTFGSVDTAMDWLHLAKKVWPELETSQVCVTCI